MVIVLLRLRAGEASRVPLSAKESEGILRTWGAVAAISFFSRLSCMTLMCRLSARLGGNPTVAGGGWLLTDDTVPRRG